MNIASLLEQKHFANNSSLWSDKPVSFGVSRNKTVENMISENGLKIINRNIDEAFLRRKSINLPEKNRFLKENNYYHIVLHEFAHFKSNKLQKNSDYKNAVDKYHEEFGKEVHTVKLIQEHNSIEKLQAANKTVFNVITTYLHEETKCELAALQTMDYAKIKADKLDLDYTGTTLGIANDLLKATGRDLKNELANENSPIRKELKILSDSMCKEYDMAKERVRVKERERER